MCLLWSVATLWRCCAQQRTLIVVVLYLVKTTVVFLQAVWTSLFNHAHEKVLCCFSVFCFLNPTKLLLVGHVIQLHVVLSYSLVIGSSDIWLNIVFFRTKNNVLLRKGQINRSLFVSIRRQKHTKRKQQKSKNHKDLTFRLWTRMWTGGFEGTFSVFKSSSHPMNDVQEKQPPNEQCARKLLVKFNDTTWFGLGRRLKFSG